MKKILVPTDFSDNALKAALYAAEIAMKANAAIFFVHAPELGHESLYQPFPLHDKYDRLVKDERTNALSHFIKNITDTYKGIKVHGELLNGRAVDAICTFSSEKEMDLIIMGTKGASGIKEVAIGSVTADVISKSNVPVLAVPAQYVLEEPDAILFATNHFERDINLLNKIAEIATLFSATVHVVVFEDINTTQPAQRGYDKIQLKQYLEFLKETFPGLAFKGELLEGTSLEGALERYGLKNEADIIAMVTYSRGFWARLLGKSNTRKMAFHSRMPLLAIPVNTPGDVTQPEGLVS